MTRLNKSNQAQESNQLPLVLSDLPFDDSQDVEATRRRLAKKLTDGKKEK